MSTAITLDAIKSTQKKLADMIATFEAQSSAISLPVTISKPDLAEGEVWIGAILAADGRAHHIILLPGEAQDVDWPDAQDWAAERSGVLPNRVESALLFAVAGDQFQKEAYWTSEQHASNAGYALSQVFSSGGQYGSHKSNQLRARAVRRIPIE